MEHPAPDAHPDRSAGLNTEPSIEGYIVGKYESAVLIARLKQTASGTEQEKRVFYDMAHVLGIGESVKVGQWVKVWFVGEVLELFSARATAGKIELVMRKKPEGAKLAEDEAIRKLFAEKPSAVGDLRMPVIKEAA